MTAFTRCFQEKQAGGITRS